MTEEDNIEDYEVFKRKERTNLRVNVIVIIIAIIITIVGAFLSLQLHNDIQENYILTFLLLLFVFVIISLVFLGFVYYFVSINKMEEIGTTMAYNVLIAIESVIMFLILYCSIPVINLINKGNNPIFDFVFNIITAGALFYIFIYVGAFILKMAHKNGKVSEHQNKRITNLGETYVRDSNKNASRTLLVMYLTFLSLFTLYWMTNGKFDSLSQEIIKPLLTWISVVLSLNTIFSAHSPAIQMNYIEKIILEHK